MPSVKTKRISTLIETQLPEFITTEYELFSKFVQKYYESQEVQGGTLDVISNIQKYADIDYYEQNILRQFDILGVSINASDDTIVLQDATSFPKKNGYVRIDDEIIFYSTRTATTLSGCSRGISGNTTLGDLYNESTFTGTTADAHNSGQKVYNISNLFLYAFVKNFENQYLGSFPEKYLKGEVDKRTLIKNIQKFYKAKGTDSSIKFVFNTIVSKDHDDKPEVYKPRDFTYKVSESDWTSVYALKCKVISGDVKSLIGQKIIQTATDEYGYADAAVDNVYADGTSDNEVVYNIVLAPETVNGDFAISTKTKTEKSFSGTSSTGNRINVSSTLGWGDTGSFLIGTETITFSSKTVTQFIIDDRQPSGALTYPTGTSVYKPVTISGSGVTLLTFGVVYNLTPTTKQPYSSPGDKIEVSNAGFETDDSKIVKVGTKDSRWIFDQGNSPLIPTLPTLQSSISELTTDVSSIFADDQYYYITSSGFPSHKILDGSTVNEELLDQKLLRIIRKNATRTTEKYSTSRRDNGILLNGIPVYSYKDHDSVRYGKLEQIKVNTQGRGYASPPFVLVDQVPNKARAVLAGEVVESIIVDTQDIFPRTPEVTITSGRGAVVRAIVTGGKVTSLTIDNSGEYYSSPPIVRIRDNAGRGRFATYNSVVNTDGNITGFEKIDEGNFYNQNTVIVDIIAVGESASGIPLLKEWNYNRYTKLENELDTENGYIFQNYNNALEYGYGYIANPKALRVSLNDNISNTGSEPATKTHSPIIGFAYDGNPIYGAFGYDDPLTVGTIVRMTSSYSINATRAEGPSVSKYPLGTFNNDYTYTHKSGTLDENNGRFCVTPEFPEGTYAYFITIDSNQVPQYPYIIGENYYSLPVDSNYNSNINQDDIPKNSKKYYVPGMQGNGEGLVASIAEVKSGTVDEIDVISTSSNFSINSQIYFNNDGTEGSEAEAIISSVKGKGVSYLHSRENKVVKLTVIQSAYLFADDTLTQPSSGAYGEIVGTVKNDSTVVLKNVVGTFDNTGTFSAAVKTFTVLLDQRSSYTKGATLSLTDGVNTPIATAEVLEGTTSQNVVQIKVLTGTWIVDDTYFLQSDDLFNTSGTRIVRLTSMSDGLEPFEVNQSVALIETTAPHGLGIDDTIDININPNHTTKVKTYYLRKRLYQEAILIPPENKTNINFTGIGKFSILNGGADYTAGTYTTVSLTGGSGSGATATFIVSDAGIVSNVTIENAGTGYQRGDYISVADEDLVRSGASQSTARLTLYVDHVGFSAGATKLVVDSALGYADNDYIKIGDEILQIVSISNNDITVNRGQQGTNDVDHFDGQEVVLYESRYNFTTNFEIFNTSTTGYVQSYDPVTQKIVVVYDYGTLSSNADKVILSSSFFDASEPKRLVSIKSAGDVSYKFEFSDDNISFVSNPNIGLQEYYKYKFDTSHSSLTGTYFDISPSNNFNLVTVEKTASTTLPGNSGAYTDVIFGFGSRLGTNLLNTKVGTDFTNFYYFDKKNVVGSDNAYFSIIQDPLQGTKIINYVTSNRIVYDVPSQPLWDGSGSISYTTTGQFAIGAINTVDIINLGLNYKKVPVIKGVDPTTDYRASATVLFDTISNIITGVEIVEKGSNYSKPKVIITDGDGSDASFDIVERNGEIFSIVVSSPGKGYTYTPTIRIIESDTQAYVSSSTIGIPQSVNIIQNGGGYHLDKTVSSNFTSSYVLNVESTGLVISLKKPAQLTGQSYWNTPTYIGPFTVGEEVYQMHIDDNTGAEVIDARGIVGEWNGETLIISEVTFGEFLFKPDDEFYNNGNYEIYGNGTTTSPGGISGNPYAYPNRAIITSTPVNGGNTIPEYQKGETVIQTIDGIEVLRAKVLEYRKGSNLLKIGEIDGTIRENVLLRSTLRSNVVSTVKTVFVTTFTEEVTSFYDNLGYYNSDKGRLGVSNQKLLDSDFYQDYSYVIKSKTPIEQWRDLIKSTTHPAGFKLFGQVDIETDATASMPEELPKASHFSVIQLWDPAKNRITVENTTHVLTQTTQKVENTRIRKGVGSASNSEFLFNENRAFEFSINGTFDGYYDNDGRLQGTKQFQILDDQGIAFTPASAKGIIVTLDGVIQEPEVAYTISGDQIIFANPPLGQGDVNGSSYKGVTFYGKVFQFKDNQYNTKYLKKLKNIFQRSGRWIDAANQIERNVEFIINETIGYGKETHTSLDWNTKQDDYEANIRAILDAYQHDIRFGGNVKTIDYSAIFNSDDAYLYIQNNKTKSNDVFSYATRLAKLAIRNWDYTDENVSYIAGTNTITVSDTSNLAVGMFVSSGKAFTTTTKIVSIDTSTQITVSSVALSNSSTSGGAPEGTTNISGTDVATGDNPTSTAAVEPGNSFQVATGATYTVPTSFSGIGQATFSWSGLQNGMFYKAGQLIALNREYILDTSITWAQTTYPSLNWGALSTKCKRDIGIVLDSYVYHLQFGGNEKVVEAAQLYYTKDEYPDTEKVSYITDQLTETLAVFSYAKDLMIQAMRNQLPSTDSTVVVDSNSPTCVEVESALNTFHGIFNTILTEGKGLVEKVSQDPNKRGNWTPTLTYSNYNIIPDPQLTGQECNNVISAIDSLYNNLSDTILENSVTRSLPDFVDGEAKEFELYWDDNTVVNTDIDEDLFLTINAVLQRPKYTESYPLFDSYVIDRSVIPNKIKFDVAPIWDQDLGAKTIGEPTAVEKVVGIGVGNYKRLTIDYNLVDGVRNGPFLILDVEDNTVQSIESEDSMYVFIDGVLQRKGYSYTVSGPNITFNVPMLKEMKVDIRYLYGRDVGQVLNIFDYAPDTYFAKARFTFTSQGYALNDFFKYAWMGDKIGLPIHVWQPMPDGTVNIIGEVSNPFRSGWNVEYDLKCQNAVIESGRPFVFAVKGAYDRTFTFGIEDISNELLDFQLDSVGRKILTDDNSLWFGTFLGKTHKYPFAYLANNDKIRIEGEEGFRRIKTLPNEATSKDGRDKETLTDDIYGVVSVETYTGITRGEGLSVVATIENGSVTGLTWNQRSYDPLTQPTAYQYETPPILEFIPVDGDGGGASANVLVSKGQVISVDLLNGGSGYSAAPKVIVSRRYDILSERDIGVSLIYIGVNPEVNISGMSAISVVNILANQVAGIDSVSSVAVNSPADADRHIEIDIQPDVLDNSTDVTYELPVNLYIATQDAVVPFIDMFYNETTVSAEVQKIISSNSISSVSRDITVQIQDVIENNALSNVNYFENAAYLDVDLQSNEHVAYVADTTKFAGYGLLMIGNEVVKYNGKLPDRFLRLLRGQQNTTPQTWTAGTYLRQIPEVTIAFGGVVTVESTSDVSMVSASASAGGVERKTHRQIETPADFSVTREATEFVIIPPPSGVVDGYEETVFVTDPIIQRSGNAVDIIEVSSRYYVDKRDGTQVEIINAIFGISSEYIGLYTKTNAGHTISFFDGIFDDGTANVSGLTLGLMDQYFPTITIADFTDRAKSSYSLAGEKFNLVPPSIQSPVTFTSNAAGAIAGTVVVPTTAYFPDEGYIFHNSFGVSGPTGHVWNQKTYGLSGTQNLETTADKKFGDRSVFLDETSGTVDGSKLNAPIGTDFGSGDFTIEFWNKRVVISNGGDSGAGLVFYGPNTTSGVDWQNASTAALNYFLPNFGFSLYITSMWSNNATVTFWNGGDDSYTNFGTVSDTNWNHVAIVRKSGTIKVYWNGIEKASKPNTQDYSAAGATAAGNTWGGGNSFFGIGDSNYSIGLDCFNGYIDEVRTSNIARYETDFTPPTEQQSPDGYTLSYDNFDTPIAAESGVIKYTGRTATQFTGCTVYSGSTTIANNATIIPYQIN
tara:strand:- start:35402 stop:46807 length:11406 start_codon:yes stop_codon:yes gene_type:complete